MAREGVIAGRIINRIKTDSKADDPPSTGSTKSEDSNTSPYRDVDRKMEADRRKIDSAITVCHC